MKIALSTTGYCLGAPLESRFGRSPRFIIYELDNGSFEVIENKLNANAPQGAGVQTAANLITADIKAVITGHCGPKAFSMLDNAKIPVYLAGNVSVSKAIELYKSKTLSKQESADVDGHWQ